MYATTNSALVWKRMADESQQSAKMLTRISIAMLLLMVAVGGYAHSVQSQNTAICAALQQEMSASGSTAVMKFARQIASGNCN